jgi:hypothetical protein
VSEAEITTAIERWREAKLARLDAELAEIDAEIEIWRVHPEDRRTREVIGELTKRRARTQDMRDRHAGKKDFRAPEGSEGAGGCG